MILKRAFDLIAGLCLFIFLLPLLGILSLLIRVKMGRPVFFRQQRPGLKGKPFILYKFRTMEEAAEGVVSPLDDEKRLTGMGRWLRRYSLDEMPQLINVIKGEVSFVGPRPLLMEYLPRYSEEQARRHEVKPGITGWAQVNGRNAISWEEKFAHDVWYVDNWSLFLDLKIIGLTILKVVKAEGIKQDGSASMPEFQGTQTYDGD